MNPKDSKFLTFIEKIPDEIRHPLLADNHTWDKEIFPTLGELIAIIQASELGLNDPDYVDSIYLFVEDVYFLGHRDGVESTKDKLNDLD